MPRFIRIFIFLLIAMVVLFGVSAFLAGFLTIGFSRSFSDFIWLSLILGIVSLVYIYGEFASRLLNIQFVKTIGAVILGIYSILFSITILGYIIFLLPVSISNSLVAQSVLLVSLFLVFWGLINAQLSPLITRVKFPIPIRIVQISDIHIDGTTSIRWIQSIVKKVNALSADVVVFTGDLLDIDRSKIQPHLNELRAIKAKYAKLAISGNHDFYSQYDQFKKAIDQIDFQLIDNKVVKIQTVTFAGIPDKDGGQFGQQKVDISHLLKNITGPIVLLDHRPDYFETAVDNGVSFQLSGHTHWGQIPPWGLLVRLRYKYGVGLKKYKNSFIYTSKGTGFWGPPMRLFGRSEIVLFDQ